MFALVMEMSAVAGAPDGPVMDPKSGKLYSHSTGRKQEQEIDEVDEQDGTMYLDSLLQELLSELK